jgi:phosphatidylserine decarboxylase
MSAAPVSEAPVAAPTVASPPVRRPIEPLAPEIRSIQPGEGLGFRIEWAWGRVRRAWLRRFRPAYVARMRALRRPAEGGLSPEPPFEVLDPRDLKLIRNVCPYRWSADHDPFAWRGRLPLARAGLVELLLIGGGFALLAAVLAAIAWPLAVAPAIAALLVLWFFRDPRRQPPSDPTLAVSPADGKVVEIRPIDHDPDLGGPAVQIAIFLSVFDVHVNRSPISGRVLGIGYRRGAFLNAMRPDCGQENEALEIRLEESEPPHRVFKVRQIVGAIARRIVCWAAPGDELSRGERYGMIKFGSRTAIVLPAAGTTVRVRVGDRVRCGETPIARLAPAIEEGGR